MSRYFDGSKTIKLHMRSPGLSKQELDGINGAMKKLTASLAIFLSFCTVVVAEDASTNAAPLRIAAADAKEHVGANVIVSATVAEVNKIQSLVRLNLEKPYPNQPLTAIIFSEKTNLFPELEKLKGKMIEISGKITEYRSRPQIVLTSTNQLKVVESAGETEKK